MDIDAENYMETSPHTVQHLPHNPLAALADVGLWRLHHVDDYYFWPMLYYPTVQYLAL